MANKESKAAGAKAADTKPKNKSTMVRDTIALFIITLVAGCLLGLVNEVTKDLIEKANLQKKMDSYRTVFSAAADFDDTDEQIKEINAMLEEMNKNKDMGEFQKVIDEANASGKYKNSSADTNIESLVINEVLRAVDSSGNLLGYVVGFTGTAGYGGNIEMSLGVDTQGTITGFEVISNSETAGLGANCTNPEFKSQFEGINTNGVIYTKSGKQAGTDPAEIDALSGATVTTKAVSRAVNGVLLFLHTYCLES